MASARAFGVAAALGLVAACGGVDDASPRDPATAASTTVGAAGNDDVGPGPTAAGADGAPAGAPVAPPPDDGGGAAPPDEDAPGTTIAAAPVLDPSGPPGSFAAAVLRPASSNEVLLELHVADGAAPSTATVEHLRTMLAAAVGKPVTVVAGDEPTGDEAWTAPRLRAAADAGARHAQGNGVAVLRLLFVRGSLGGDDGVLGVAVRGDVAAVFTDRAAAAAGLLGDPEAVVVSVAGHELGHLLGLVDLVLDTGRADPDHPGHSSNPGSVMYWAVESDLVTSLLGNRPPRDFDADDLADLRAIAAGG